MPKKKRNRCAGCSIQQGHSDAFDTASSWMDMQSFSFHFFPTVCIYENSIKNSIVYMQHIARFSKISNWKTKNSPIKYPFPANSFDLGTFFIHRIRFGLVIGGHFFARKKGCDVSILLWHGNLARKRVVARNVACCWRSHKM